MAQLEHIEAIEKRLWSAADTLRANSNYDGRPSTLPMTTMAVCSPPRFTEKR
jgi:type I restriction enzyme M protein